MIYFKTLDTFRFFCFFLVFLSHQHILYLGHIGVLGFFVLSAFLLTPKLFLLKSKEYNFTIYLKSFLRNRFLRIFPLYFLFLILVYSFTEFLSNDSLFYASTYTYNFLFIKNLLLEQTFDELPHLWSLSVEEQMYIVLPFLIWFFYNRYNKLIVFSLVLIFISKILVFFYFKDHYLNSTLFSSSFIYVFTPFYISCFLIGGYFGLYAKKFIPNSFHLVIFFTIILSLGFLSSYLVDGVIPYRSFGYAPSFVYGYQWLWAYFVWAIFFGCILLLLKTPGNFLYFLFDDAAFAYLGKISYGLYVFHYPIILLCNEYFPPGLIFQFFTSLFFTILISFLSYELFEKHFLKYK